MSANKCYILLLLACCLAALAVADVPGNPANRLIRRQRSPQPQHGPMVLTADKDEAGRQANNQYNHNLFTRRNGLGSIGNPNIDYNHNSFGGGIQGNWRF
ncbi:uncharacterized protein edin [Drosophila virilis]|uniref:Attacin C-terminal domain-containing protein n=1 Tax=Drosophila virilis TaxID=7244 RepID=B4LFS0_DROVI|nr:uncharacterized protein LOC6623280 [Drosophila virilis]EDW69297.1 uncharacterized protein Dvir_GJ13166 [Drosophila virilis]